MRNIDYRKNHTQKLHEMIGLRIPFFIKIILACTIACFAMIILGWIVIRSWIEPPVVPSNTQNVTMPNLDDLAFLPLVGAEEGINEDMYIGGGLRAPEGFTADDRKEQFFTFLIIGIDGGVNTDTIMVASYDGINKEANIISIPRDCLVNVKRGIRKINAAYPIGTLRGGGRAGGIDQLQREIKTIIGFIPDYYISVDFNAFVRLVDTIGGIDVYVPMDMRYNDRSQRLAIDIKMGEQHLDGENALKFARYRKSNRGSGTITDFQRNEHQQAVIKAMFVELMKPSNIFKIPVFLDIFHQHVHSDISDGNLLWFAEGLNKLRGTEALSMYAIPILGSSGPPMYYEFLDKAGVVELVNRTINPFTIDIEAKDLDIVTRH